LLRLAALFLLLTLLFPLPSLLSALLVLALPFGLTLLVALPALLLRLTLVVAALFIGLPALGFVVAPVVILVLLRFRFFTADAPVFTVGRFLCVDQPGRSRQGE
jgi:hypothetical protein